MQHGIRCRIALLAIIGPVLYTLSSRPAMAQTSWPGLSNLLAFKSRAQGINDAGQVVGSIARREGGRRAVLWQDGAMKDLGGMDSEAWAINKQGMVVGSSRNTAGMIHAVVWKGSRIRDLGTLGGSFSEARAMDDKGRVVGYSDTPTGARHAFLWQNGKMTDLTPGLTGYENSIATAINNAGQVAITLYDVDGYILRARAYLWMNGKLTDLGVLPGYENSVASDINASGQIVGCSFSNIGDFFYFVQIGKGFLWQQGVLSPMPALGGDFSQATGINDSGQVVGYSTSTLSDGQPSDSLHACLWQNGQPVDIGRLPGFTESMAGSINASGQVAGFCFWPVIDDSHAFIWHNGVMKDLTPFRDEEITTYGISQNKVVGQLEGRAFLWEMGKLTDLGTLGGSTSEARAVNKDGMVVGSSKTGTGETHAFLWHEGQMIDLTPDLKGMSVAYGISSDGQVVGQANGHAFLWRNGQRIDLTPGLRGMSVAYGISQSGQVVGMFDAAKGVRHGFIWQNGQLADLTPGLFSQSVAYSINQNRQVVGQADGLAFLWQDGIITYLGSLGGATSTAYSINDLGLVAGYAQTASGKKHAFVWQADKMEDMNDDWSLVPGVELNVARGISYDGDVGVDGSVHGYHTAFLAGPGGGHQGTSISRVSLTTVPRAMN